MTIVNIALKLIYLSLTQQFKYFLFGWAPQSNRFGRTEIQLGVLGSKRIKPGDSLCRKRTAEICIERRGIEGKRWCRPHGSVILCHRETSPSFPNSTNTALNCPLLHVYIYIYIYTGYPGSIVVAVDSFVGNYSIEGWHESTAFNYQFHGDMSTNKTSALVLLHYKSFL